MFVATLVVSFKCARNTSIVEGVESYLSSRLSNRLHSERPAHLAWVNHRLIEFCLDPTNDPCQVELLQYTSCSKCGTQVHAEIKSSIFLRFVTRGIISTNDILSSWSQQCKPVPDRMVSDS